MEDAESLADETDEQLTKVAAKCESADFVNNNEHNNSTSETRQVVGKKWEINSFSSR